MQSRISIVLVAIVAVLVGTASVAQAELIAHWTFDETSGNTAFDETSNNHDGTVSGATMGVSGKINYAYSFDADNDVVYVPDADDLDGMTNLTLTSWVYMPERNSSSAGRIVMNKPGAWCILFKNNGELSGEIKSGSWQSVLLDYEDAITSGWFSYNEWNHVAFVFEPAADKELRLYLNGVCRAEADSDKTSVAAGSYDVGLGASPKTPPDGDWLGGLDDMRVYNEALSDADIYAMGVPEPSTLLLLTTGLLGLLAYAWRKRK